MKRIILYSLIILILPACKKFLHEEEISIGKIENYDQMVAAAGGVYGGLSNSMRTFGSFYVPNFHGDDLVGGYNYNPFYKPKYECSYDTSSIPYKPSSLGTWSDLYKVIASANNILVQFKNLPPTDNRESKILGEIYLIRAYCYFRLTRTFGRIPIIDNIDIDYNVTKSSFDDIYKFIESDLKKAMVLLPENNSSARIPFVTPHRGSAKAMLAEVYLSWAGYPCKDPSKYLQAAKEAGETIDSSGYFGFRLLEDFSYLWDSAHLCNTESIFSLYCSNLTWIDHKYVFDEFYNGRYSFPLSEKQKQINFKQNFYPQYISLDFNGAKRYFFNHYPVGYRKEITFFTNIYYDLSQYDNSGNIISVDTGHIHIEKTKDCGYLAYRKFYYQPEVDTTLPPNYRASSVPYLGVPRTYIFRYSQTVLTYAEAMARSGQLNEKAYECVNQIRRRARHLDLNSPSAFDLQPGLSPDAFADSVVWERAWELCGEPEGRWFDLIRLEMVEDLPKLLYPMESGSDTYDKSYYFFLIDPSDTLLNPNLRGE